MKPDVVSDMGFWNQVKENRTAGIAETNQAEKVGTHGVTSRLELSWYLHHLRSNSPFLSASSNSPVGMTL